MHFWTRDFIAIFMGALIQGATGFGGAVIMNAVMSLFHQLKMLSPLISAYKLLIGSITLGGRVIRGRLKLGTYKPQRNHKRIHLAVFVVASFVGIYQGKIVLLSLDNQSARRLIAALVLVWQTISWYSGNNEMDPGQTSSDTQVWKRHSGDYLWTLLLGIGAGIFGYAYNTNGPFIALFVLFQGLRKKHAINFSTLYFLGMSIIFLVMHKSFGLMSNLLQPDILRGFCCAALGATIGVCLQKHINEIRYRQLINIFLIISIILLLI